MRYLIVLTLPLLLLTGCTFGHWEYSSETGRRCALTCDADERHCTAYCRGDWACFFDCSVACRYCYEACPDLAFVSNNAAHNWHKDFENFNKAASLTCDGPTCQ